jgi:hypothetical protein
VQLRCNRRNRLARLLTSCLSDYRRFVNYCF